MRPDLYRLVRPVAKVAGRVGIVALSRSGKSCLLRESIRGLRGYARIVVYDKNSILRVPIAEDPRSFWLTLGDPFGIVGVRDPRLLRAVMPWLLQYGHVVLVVDEAQDIFPPNVRGIAQEVVLNGRNRGLGILWATQRPSKVTQDLLGNCETTAIGRLTAPVDVQKVRAAWGMFERMPLHRFRCEDEASRVFYLESRPD